MKVLYLSQPNALHPWYDDVVDLSQGRHDILLFNPTLPLEDQIRDAAVVVDQGGGMGTPELMSVAKRHGVQLWQVLGTGLDHFDMRTAKECGLLVANTPGIYSALALAEHCLFLMLCLLKRYSAAGENIASQIPYAPMVQELNGKTLGLVGFGASGQELARQTVPLGLRTMAVDVAVPHAKLLSDLHTVYLGDLSQLEVLLEKSDIVSLHVPLVPQTVRMINSRSLRSMKRDAILINVARGELIDEKALWVALSEGRIAGAGLDVFTKEPVDPNHQLLSLKNVVATPHIAGMTHGTSRRRATAIVENLDRVAKGCTPLYVVS